MAAPYPPFNGIGTSFMYHFDLAAGRTAIPCLVCGEVVQRGSQRAYVRTSQGRSNVTLHVDCLTDSRAYQKLNRPDSDSWVVFSADYIREDSFQILGKLDAFPFQDEARRLVKFAKSGTVRGARVVLRIPPPVPESPETREEQCNCFACVERRLRLMPLGRENVQPVVDVTSSPKMSQKRDDLTFEGMDRLPKYYAYTDSEEAGKECGICLDVFGSEAEIIRLPCFHEFHTACLAKWVLASKSQRNPLCPQDQQAILKLLRLSEL